jgi:hypothetical protein
MYTEIKKCRICGNTDLVTVLNLGNQQLTGVFPKSKDQNLTSGPLELVKCNTAPGKDSCGLLQLKHSYEFSEIYGMNYGYRSALNKSMVTHLHGKVAKILEMVKLNPADIVLDIGSNDSTLLQGYPKGAATLVGMDPTGKKFSKYYPGHIELIPDFFSAANFKARFGAKKAKIITSIAMFYDLESPLDFVKEIAEILDDNGVWVFEQSYMPTMLEMNAYDTVCHEHLEYYSLSQIKWMTGKAGLKIADVELNAVNGGSFSVTVSKSGSVLKENKEVIDKLLKSEVEKGLDTLAPYQAFKKRVFAHRDDLIKMVNLIKSKGKKILGYGASTKGNVVLQFCGFKENDIPYIAEVNTDKYGSFTPGTHIPIVSEEDAKAGKPDYFLVLPWHFRDNIISREKEYLKGGGSLLFPLPSIKIVDSKGEHETI